eukprot:SM000004S14939  [mRNA]  locus=s4:296552:303781:- [translate_table: standard]
MGSEGLPGDEPVTVGGQWRETAQANSSSGRAGSFCEGGWKPTKRPKAPTWKPRGSRGPHAALASAVAAAGSPGRDDGAGDGAGKPKAKAVRFWQLFRYADRLDLGLMVLGTAGAVVNGAAMPLLALLLGQLINAFGQNTAAPSSDSLHHLVDQVTAVALRFVYVAVGAAIAAYLEVACWMLAGERLSARIRALYLQAILRQDVAFFDKETSTGEVVGRMSGDTILIQEATGEKVGSCIRLMATFLAGFVVAFVRGWELTLVMLAVLPVLAVCGGFIGSRIAKFATASSDAYAEAGSVVEQAVGGIRTVASFVGESRAVAQYERGLGQAYAVGVKSGLATGLGIGCALFVMFSAYGLAMWYGSLLVTRGATVVDGFIVAAGAYNGGQVLSVLFSVIIGGMSLGQASPSLAAFAAGQVAAYKMYAVIDRKPPIDVEDESGLTPPDMAGAIELRNVRFAYPTRKDVAVFSDFSLCIPAGKTLALVGESGSGKSTVVALLERFYDPQGGQVLIDGVDIRRLQLRWLRRHLALVSQEPVLFGTSIRENIAYGKPDATDAEIAEAAKMANVHKFVSSLPQGYDTQVGERGTQLSGGQKQRVAIARAVLQNPRVLLLDEATSALDAESERVVQEALDRIMAGRTTVVVAHRLSTVQNADMIAVLQRGAVVETGTHKQLLMQPDGAYSQLVRLQHVGPGVVTLPTAGPSSDVDQLPIVSLSSTSGLGAKCTLGQQEGLQKGVIADDLAGLKKRKSKVWSCLSRERKTDEEEGAAVKPRPVDIPMRRVAVLNKPELPYAVLGTLACIGNGLIFPLFSILLSSIIKTFYVLRESKLKSDASFWAGMFVVLGAASLVLLTTQMWMWGLVGSRLVRRIRRLTFAAVLRQEVAWFDDSHNSSGAIGARLNTDAAHVKGMVGDRLALLLQNCATIVAGLVIAFRAGWQLSLVILSVVPLLAIAGYVQVSSLKGFSANAKLMYEDASHVASEAVGSIRTVAAFTAEKKVLQLYQEKCAMPVQAGIRQSQVAGVGLGFANFVLFSTYALAFWYGSTLVEDGKSSFKKVFNVFFAIVMSAMGVAQNSGFAPDFSKVQVAVNSIFAILDRQPVIDAAALGRELVSVRGDIQLNQLKFCYPTRPDTVVFNGLSLSIRAGQTMALVGESGSGKSTVIALLERFYDPLSGSITIDGVDTRTLQLKWLRQQMGLVSQEPVLFDATIRDNIAYGKGGATEEELVQAAKAANAHRFILDLPSGYETRVGERGIQLSGGQKQRVAIARAIVKDPRILLLDEATSALDAESEHVVQEALDALMIGRTTVVIAHRLTTVRNADVIAVVKQGRIAEQGRHEELLRIPGGAYSSLVKLHQASA